MLDNVLDFVGELFKLEIDSLANPQRRPAIQGGGIPLVQTADIGDLYCPQCGGHRRMKLTPVFVPQFDRRLMCEARDAEFQLLTSGAGGRLVKKRPTNDDLQIFAASLVPAMFLLNCVQCDARFTTVIHQSPVGPNIAILPAINGGLRTPHTPASVAYYLDQAQRSKSVGAYSAALSMYRAAVEQLLLNEGYAQRMCGPKLQALEAAIVAGTAPKWAMTLETEYLTILKNLGDGSIHAGDIAKQALLDSALLDDVTDTMLHLLFVVYEADHEKNTRLNHIRSRAAAMKK